MIVKMVTIYVSKISLYQRQKYGIHVYIYVANARVFVQSHI